MLRFEDRLATAIASVMGLALLGGCGGGSKEQDELEAMCDGGAAPEDYQLALGFVEIPLGGDCPDAADAPVEAFECTFLEWQDITCGFDRVDTDQVFVSNGYGGFYADEATATTSSGALEPLGDPVDVCYYEAVFYLDPNHPTCGRPLLREGQAVVAAVRGGRSGWSQGAHPVVAGLHPDDRAAVAAHWLESAVMEHASVASFAHFSLDLMRFGAPPELLAASQQAALDEIEHARLCFALASGYRGAPVGPGALPVTGMAVGSLAEVVEALVREGCIGETLAAVDAAARLAVATDPAVRTALAVILRDESAHAALAWRALRWFLEQDTDGSIRARLDAVFAEEAARWTAPDARGGEVSAGARAHGLISAGVRARELRRAWEAAIAPTWAELQQGSPTDAVA